MQVSFPSPDYFRPSRRRENLPPVLVGLGAALIFASCLAATGAKAADIPVDLELVLAVDVSRSMDEGEQRLQKEGYVAALRHPEVLTAIRSGLVGRIAITYFEWSGPASQRVIVPWRMIEDAESADAVAAEISASGHFGQYGTSISSSLVFAASLFEGSGYAGDRQVIDVSGDGPNNMGGPVEAARAAVLARGITINGLPIVLRPGGGGGFSRFDIDGLDQYYRDCVVGGPGSFTVAVTSSDQFESAIRRKLVLEIADIGRKERPLVERIAGESLGDCMIGERLRDRWRSP